MFGKRDKGVWFAGDTVWGTSTMVYEGSDDPHVGAFVCDCDPPWFDEDEAKLAGDGNPQHTAQRIADEHNERDRLAQENAALLAVLEAADKCVGVIYRRTNSWDYAEIEYAHVEALREAIEKARALVGSSSGQGE